MGAVRVRDPQGRLWKVRRRWTPWRRRMRDVDPLDVLGLPDIGGGSDPISVILTVIALIVLVPVIILAAIALLELLLILLLIPLVMLGRIALRRPWIVEIVGPDGHYATESVPGYGASGARVQAIAAAIAAGTPAAEPDPGHSAPL